MVGLRGFVGGLIYQLRTWLAVPIPPPATPKRSEAARPANTEPDEVEEYLLNIRKKLDLLADDFAHGRINRAQYEELYNHYQKQKRTIEGLALAFADGDPEDARLAVKEGRSLIIRRQNQADVISFSIYANDSSVPLATHGKFLMDSALVIGMLSGFRDASREMLGARLRKTEVEDGKVLCFVSGEKTTLIVLYSIEPAPNQLDSLKRIHQEFEITNRPALNCSRIDPQNLVVPVDQILGAGPKFRSLAEA